MIIKEHEYVQQYQTYNFPDLFVSDETKRSKKYIKMLLDFFQDQALLQYKKNAETFAQNYRFLKGDLRPADFYEDEQVKEFYETLTEDNPLPKYVQQYSVMNMPVNTLWGEFMSKPDNSVVKAFDADSKSEELEFMTNLMMDYATSTIQMKIFQKAAEQGADLANEEVIAELQAQVQKQVEEGMSTFTTQGEKWANRVLEALKREFNIKDQSGDAYRDLLISGRPRLHIYRDKSPTGFNIKAVNPKNVWGSFNKDHKYFKKAAFAGIIEVMDISEIIDMFHLTKKEIDTLKEEVSGLYDTYDPGGSQLFSKKVGINSIDYKPVHPNRQEEQYLMESALMKEDEPQDMLLSADGTNVLGQKHIVVTAYHQAKIQVGQLVYINQEGLEETVLVGEDYKNGDHPGELSIDWTYDNQWWKSVKIGNQVYFSEPLEILDYCPIIGMNFDQRNSAVKSLVDLMKPYQMIFNVCMNQLWELLQKEFGVVFEFNQRHIPGDKDGELEDSIGSWLSKAAELGLVFTDDSIENMKVPSSSNTNVNKVHNLSRAQEMQSRLAICQEIERRCHALVGVNPERLGGVAATQTATGTQAALSSSYAQTQIWSDAIENILNQAYQAIIDVAQYIESNKELSTISYLTEEGDRAFFEIKGKELKFKDFRCLVTSQTEDLRKLEALRNASQALLQNGLDVYSWSKLQVSNSIREIQETFKKTEEQKQAQIAQQQQLEQQQLQQQQAQFEQAQQAQQQLEMFRVENDNNQKELERINKVRVSLINASGRDKTVLEDADNDGTADALALTSMDNEVEAARRQYELGQAKLASEASKQQQKLLTDKEKNKNDYELRVRELDIKEKEIQQRAEDSKRKLQIASKNKNKYDKSK